MTIHHLKVWPEFYSGLADGSKTAEVRWNDRGFKVGDMLHLYEYIPGHGATGRWVTRTIGRVDDLAHLTGTDRLAHLTLEGWVLLSFAPTVPDPEPSGFEEERA